MRIVLAAVHPELAQAWTRAFEGVPDVRVHAGSLFDVPCDALVSPANSFGFMDGGIDAALCERFGWSLQTRVQDQIRAKFNGELLVGQALIVPTEDAQVPFLIAAPTMRVPMNVARSYQFPWTLMDAAPRRFSRSPAWEGRAGVRSTQLRLPSTSLPAVPSAPRGSGGHRRRARCRGPA